MGRVGGPGRLEPTGDDFWSARANKTLYENRKSILGAFCRLFTSPSRCLPTPSSGPAARRSTLVLMLLLLPPEPLRMHTASPSRALLIIA